MISNRHMGVAVVSIFLLLHALRDVIYGFEFVCPYVPRASIVIEQQGDRQNRRRNLPNGLVQACSSEIQIYSSL